MANTIQIKRGPAANWTSTDPVLAIGEQGYETDTGKVKIGDGATAWSSLPYLVPADVSDLTDTTSLLGGGGGSFDAVASGSLSDGSTVIVNSDGTVSVVAQEGFTAGPGTPSVFESAVAAYTSATFDSSSNKVVIVYQDVGNSNYGTAVVGTVSGTSISFGTPVVFESASVTYNSATFDSANNKVVIAYRDDGSSSYGTAVVGTVSGTSISFGTPVVFESASTWNISATFDSANNKVVIAYADFENSNYGTAVVGTVSGTSISFGTPVVLNSASTLFSSVTFDSNSNKVVIAYNDFGNSSYGTAVVGTVSGTSISFGTPVVFKSGPTYNIAATFDSTNNKVVIAYRDLGNSNYGTAVVGTVSGTSISFGTPVVFENATTDYTSATFDSANNKVVIVYRDRGNSDYGTAIVGTVSGTSISFETSVVFENATTDYTSAIFDSNSNKVVIAYGDAGNSDYGTAVVYQTVDGPLETNLTAENYAGISSAAYSDAATATIQTAGSVDDAQSGLTPGQAYYVQGDGTLGLTPGTPSVFAGVAINATSLLIGKSEAIPTNLTDLGITDGTAGQVLSADGDGTYSFIDAASGGGGGGSFDAVASGSLSDGSAVIVNSDGTVSVVAEEGFTAGPGTPSVFNSANTSRHSATFDSANNKVVVAYEDNENSNYGTAVVGTVSGTSISFGTPTIFESADISDTSATFDSENNKVVIAYRDNGNSSYGTAVVGTVSGTSISFGTPAVFASVNASQTSATFDSASNKIVIAYRNGSNSSYGTAVVGTVSGTSISFGTPVVFNSAGNTFYIVAIFDSANNKVVIAYTDGGNSNYGTAVVGTVSGTSISFGTPVVFESATTYNNSPIFDSANNKVVIGYQDAGNSNYGTAIVGTVSGTSISFGTPVVFESAISGHLSATFDSANNKVVIAYADFGNSGHGTAVVGTVSGTSISFGTPVVFESADTVVVKVTFDSANNKVVIAYRDDENSFYGTAIVYQSVDANVTNLTAENYIGLSSGAYSDAATATVQIVGSVDDAQSGLTPGKKYYVQTDGSLSTVADDPEVFAGTAVSSTKLIVKG